MKIAITGSTGFVGKNLCNYLSQRGYHVTGIVRRQNQSAVFDSSVKTAVADVTSIESLTTALSGIDVVINLAALFNNPESSWEEYQAVNVQGVTNVCYVAKNQNVKRVIHCSTVGVATGSGPKPFSEETPYSPPKWDKYEATKCKGEQAALQFYEKNGFPVVVIRPAQVYGVGDKSKAKFYKMVKKGVIVHPGNTIKHLIYITDLCRAFECALNSKEAVGQAIIIAGKEVTPLSDLIKTVAKELNVPEPKIQIPALPVVIFAGIIEKCFDFIHKKPPIFRRSMDFFVKSVHFKTLKAKEILGFESDVPVAEGVQKTAQWYKENHLI